MSRRSYGQYCGVARALDLIGDRWTLLIVRELLIAPSRYGELAAALPGVASNLLAERLRALEADGIVGREIDPDRNGVRYTLTSWGAELGAPIAALARWSTPLMESGRGTDCVQGHWLVIALRAVLSGRTAASPVRLGIDTACAWIDVEIDASGVVVAPSDGPPRATLVRAEPEIILGMATGAISIEDGLAAAELSGDPAAVRAVFFPA